MLTKYFSCVFCDIFPPPFPITHLLWSRPDIFPWFAIASFRFHCRWFTRIAEFWHTYNKYRHSPKVHTNAKYIPLDVKFQLATCYHSPMFCLPQQSAAREPGLLKNIHEIGIYFIYIVCNSVCVNCVPVLTHPPLSPSNLFGIAEKCLVAVMCFWHRLPCDTEWVCLCKCL